MKKRLWTILILIVVLAVGICTLAACVDTPEPEPPEPETPTDNTLTYLGDLSKALAETAAMNPEDGFLMDLAANVAWNFKDEEKASLYNWSYGLNIKANVFVDGETRQGLMIELKDTYPERYSDEQKTAGEDVLFGIYNTTDENLFVKVGKNASYHFDRVGVSTALKSVLKANGIDLDFNLKDVEVGEYGKVGEFLEAALPLLVSVFDKVEKDGNNYVLDFKYSKLYSFVESLLKEAGVDLSALPEAVTNVLPKEMTFQAVVKTDGKLITGIDVKDAVMETKDGAGDGTFNLTSDFTLFGAPAETLDVEASVAQSLKDLPAVKILNVNTHGDIQFEKVVTVEEPVDPGTGDPTDPGTGEPTDPGTETPAAAATTTATVTRTISWQLRANLDLFKLIEKNFIFDDEIFSDNFLHLQLAIDGDPILDLAYAPESLDTTDFFFVIGISKVLKEFVPPIDTGGGEPTNIGEMLEQMGLIDFAIPINTTALGYMISGKGGKVEAPLPATTWYQPAIYETVSEEGGNGGATDPGATDPEVPTEPETPTGIEGIIDLVKKIVTVGGGELDVNLEELFKALKLDASVTDAIDYITKDANNVAFRNNVFEFAKAENAAYDTTAGLLKGKPDPETGEPTERSLRMVTQAGTVGFATAIDFETNAGALKVFRITEAMSKAETAYDGTRPITLEELNSFVGNTQYQVRFNGHDIYGDDIGEGIITGMLSPTNAAMIAGYIGLDPTLIGQTQTIEVVTGIPDQFGLFGLVQMMLPMLGQMGVEVDLSFVTDLLAQLKFQRFKADVVLSEAVYRADLINKTTGRAMDSQEIYNVFNTAASTNYGIRATVTYLPNEAFPERTTETYMRTDNKLTDEGQGDIHKPLYLEAMPFAESAKFATGNTIGLASQSDVTVKFHFRGAVIEKGYRFETLRDVTIAASAGNDQKTVGAMANFNALASQIRISGFYDRGTADPSDDLMVPDFYLQNITDKTFEFVNCEEMTGKKQSEYGLTTSYTYIKPGVAEYRVNIGGVSIGTLKIPVLPVMENAALTDVVRTVEEDGTLTVKGNFAFTFAEAFPDGINRIATFKLAGTVGNNSANIVSNSNCKFGGKTVSYLTGGEGVELELSGSETSYSIPFEMKGIAVYDIFRLSVTVTLRDATSVVLLKQTYFAAETGIGQDGYYEPSKNAVLTNRLVFRVEGASDVYKIQWSAGAYKFVMDADHAIDATVGMYDAENALIEDGLDAANGKILKNGTLRVSAVFDGVTYTYEKKI